MAREKTRVLFARDVREANTFGGPPPVEVVELANHERVVDGLREDNRNMVDELAVIDRLTGALPDQTTLSAVLRVVREAEAYRQARLNNSIIRDT